MFAAGTLECAHWLDTSGAAVRPDLRTSPEDFDIIPTNQALYCVDQSTPEEVVKVSSNLLTNYWGDLLITQAGDGRGLPGGKLFIVHWDSTNSTFVTRSLSDCGHDFEHITFAPIDLLSTTKAPCP